MCPATKKLLDRAKSLSDEIVRIGNLIFDKVSGPASSTQVLSQVRRHALLGDLEQQVLAFRNAGESYPQYEAERLITKLKECLEEMRGAATAHGIDCSVRP